MCRDYVLIGLTNHSITKCYSFLNNNSLNLSPLTFSLVNDSSCSVVRLLILISSSSTRFVCYKKSHCLQLIIHTNFTFLHIEGVSLSCISEDFLL